MSERSNINKKLRKAKTTAKQLKTMLRELDKDIHNLYDSGTQVHSQISQMKEIYGILRN